MSSNSTRKKLQCLLQQNVYMVYPDVPCVDQKSDYDGLTYITIDRLPTSDGFGVQDTFSEVPYPITPDSVQSYADSCDYINNSDALNAHSQHYYGDISDYQRVQAMDDNEMQSVMRDLQNKLDILKAAQVQVQPQETQPQPQSQENKE
ncbi:hypothetical protein [Dipodfec virus UOA04_Rod_734]|nr:hypothetical protein [Dipodfec virus UOA04_Rod_734]